MAIAEKLENQFGGRGDLSDSQWKKLEPLLPPGRCVERGQKTAQDVSLKLYVYFFKVLLKL